MKQTKLWLSSAMAHRLPEPTAIIYHQNSIVTCRNAALTFGKVAGFIARNLIFHGAASRALVVGKPQLATSHRQRAIVQTTPKRL